MIIDKIEGILFYKPMTPALETGITAAKAVEKLEPGKYRFDGGHFNIQKGEAKPMNEGTFGTYHRYIDAQILAEGYEEVVWVDMGDLKTVIPYDREEDAERLSGDTKDHIRVDRGIFYIVFPHDGHKLVSHTDESRFFTKIIIKIPILERT